jgi:hypothetical protein
LKKIDTQTLDKRTSKAREVCVDNFLKGTRFLLNCLENVIFGELLRKGVWSVLIDFYAVFETFDIARVGCFKKM